MTKKDRILHLLKNGILNRGEIAEVVGCSPQYVSMTAWRERHKGYGARWMRAYRQDNPAAYAGDLERQRISQKKRYAVDPGYRAQTLASAQRWRKRNPDYLRLYRQRQRETSP